MGTVIFTITLNHAVWSYSPQEGSRKVDVEVERSLLENPTDQVSGCHFSSAKFAANRRAIERAARKIIDREGPNFAEPVRVTAQDI